MELVDLLFKLMIYINDDPHATIADETKKFLFSFAFKTD